MSEPHVVSNDRYPRRGEVCKLTARYTDAYELVGVRAKGKVGIRPKDSREGLKGNMSYLCDVVPSSWVHTERAYVMSITAARVVQMAHLKGWTAGLLDGLKDPEGICHTYKIAKQLLLK